MLAIISATLVLYMTPWRKHVRIKGVVVDEKTLKPVARAKVLIELRRNGFPYYDHSVIGTMTDEAGKFALDFDAKRRFHDIIVEVSTPSDWYGAVTNPPEEVTIIASPLPPYLQRAWGFHYKSFRGGSVFGRDPDLNFVGQGWSTEEP